MSRSKEIIRTSVITIIVAILTKLALGWYVRNKGRQPDIPVSIVIDHNYCD